MPDVLGFTSAGIVNCMIGGTIVSASVIAVVAKNVKPCTIVILFPLTLQFIRLVVKPDMLIEHIFSISLSL